MKVATWHGGTRFTLDEVPEPVAGPGQVVVAVETAGICGTDVHATPTAARRARSARPDA